MITLTAIDELLHDRFEVSRVLVIAPLRVAEDTWSRESAKWDHLKHLTISKLLGSAPERRKALSTEADIYVINRENVVWLTEELAASKTRWPFDMVVIDELSSFKSNSAKRFKALKKVRPMIDRIVGLTGTPAANSLMDLWAEMYLLDRGRRLGATLTSYREEYFRPGWSNGAIVYKWEARPGAMQAITKKISDITVSMKAGDYIELPDRIDSTVSVKLDPKARKQYQAMEHDSLLKLSETDEIVALDAAAVMSKLLQLANGFVYTETHDAIRIHTAKLEALEEIIEAADSPVLVYYNFRADKEALLEWFKDAEFLENDKAIARWNAGKIKILLAHPASVAYGLNLQDGGHIIAWYGIPWSLELYQQANARLHRQGQEKPVLVYHLVTEGTADEAVLKKLAEKDITQNALIDILKDKMGGKTWST